MVVARLALQLGWSRLSRLARRLFVTAAVASSLVLPNRGAAQNALHLGPDQAELVLAEVSPRILQLRVAPRDDAGEPVAAPPSSALVELHAVERLRLRTIDGSSVVTVGDLHVEISGNPLTIAITDEAGQHVQTLTLDETSTQLGFRVNAPVFGLGEGAQQFDRRGARYSMRDGWGAWDRPALGSWVAVPLIVGTDGWALFVHHPKGVFDLRTEEGTFTPWANDQREPLVAYLIAWRTPAEMLAEYARLVGHAPLPPRWAMGYMQSHRTLAGPKEVLTVARTFREKRLPCDALIYLGTGYCPAGWNTGHDSLEFNPATFDKPAEMLDTLHDMNFRVVLHKNAPPRRLTGTQMIRVEEPSASPTTGPTNALDSNGRRRTSDISDYWQRHRQTFALGVDGWWPDDGDELSHESRIARHRTYYEGALLDRPNVRPWSLHRTGYAGVARFGGWIWSGDIDSRWRTLAAQVAVGQNHGLSLTPFWGTDIGGFYPSRELTGELYVRWFQFGAFCPSFRAHGRTWHLRLPWGWNTGERGPDEHEGRGPQDDELHNAAVEPICRKYLELRYQLLPYNYTLCREAHDQNLPLMRALWLHYPGDEAARTRGDEYLWGRDLLVAPVTERGAASRRVYLPRGDRWYDFWSGATHDGGQEITRAVDLETLPLFVRAGAIIPVDPVRQFTAQDVDELTTLRVYTGDDGEFTLYEDDGASQEYMAGTFRRTRLAWNDAERRLTIERIMGDGALAAQPRRLIIELVPGGERTTVEYDGDRAEVRF
jgi:alpha-glucosidase (family GH31 glycosyl hydrolase)